MAKKETQQEKAEKISPEDKASEQEKAQSAEGCHVKDDKSSSDEKAEPADEKAEESKEKENQPEKKAKDATPEDLLKAAQKEIAELKDRYLRSVAEFDNYRKRTLKEKAELIMNGGEKTIAAILPILDDFERALSNPSNDPKVIREGIDLIFKKFQKTLSGLGVKKIETGDKEFDTEYMEAVAMVPGMGDDKKGKVIDCVQTGYTLNDKVIRHAKVAVGQ